MATFPFSPPSSIGPDPELLRRQAAGTHEPTPLATGGEAYLITRHEDVRTTLADPRFSRAAGSVPGSPTMMPGTQGIETMVNMDPPDHTRLRRLVSQAFNARAVERMRPRVERIVHDLVDGMILDEAATGDLVTQFAQPLPATVISVMLGVPLAGRAVLWDWVLATTSLARPEPGAIERATATAAGYLAEAFEQRRRSPRDDLMTALVQAHDSGDRLSLDELVSTVMLLFSAGQETTASQLSSGVLLFSQHPEQWARLVADPSLVPAAVEELLRFTRLVEVGMPRVATVDVQLSTGVIPAGASVLPATAAANRDPAVFADPKRFDISRPASAVSGHIAFGHGPHFCPGAALARLELQAAFTALVTRMPRLRVTGTRDLKWNVATFTGGLTELPISWD